MKRIDPTYQEIPVLIRLATQDDILEPRYLLGENGGYIRKEYKDLYKLKPNVNYLIKDEETGAFKNYCHVTGLHTNKEAIRDLYKKKLLYVIANDLENNSAFAKAKTETTPNGV